MAKLTDLKIPKPHAQRIGDIRDALVPDYQQRAQAKQPASLVIGKRDQAAKQPRHGTGRFKKAGDKRS